MSFSRLSPDEISEIRSTRDDPRYRAMNERERGMSVRYSGTTPTERFDNLISWLRVLSRLKRFTANRAVVINTINKL